MRRRGANGVDKNKILGRRGLLSTRRKDSISRSGPYIPGNLDSGTSPLPRLPHVSGSLGGSRMTPVTPFVLRV